MKIKSLASSSAGNCYLLDDGESSLLIECGIPISKIREGLDFKLTKVAGCLVSHSHRDHCKAVQPLMRCGIDCYSSQETFDSFEITSHRAHPIEPKKQFKVGSWTVLPFETIHDTDGSLGFLIANGKDKILFATDTAYIPHKFKGLTHIMIESNYQPEILADNIERGSISIAQKNRLLFSHMSLDNVLKFLESIDRSKLQEIYLMHLSSGNSNAAEMKRKVAGLTGIPTTICAE